MRVQHQIVAVRREGHVEVIIHDAAVAVHPMAAALDVPHPFQHQGNRAGGLQRLGQIAGRQRHPLGGIVHQLQKGRIATRHMEQRTVVKARQPAPLEGIGASCQQKA